MADHYRIALTILKQLLAEAGESHWANWISEDIAQWDINRDVKHHLGAYGGMGSINDLQVGTNDKFGIWNDQVFTFIKNLAWTMANSRSSSALIPRNFYNKDSIQLSGWRCRSCGHARLDEVQIEHYLAKSHLPKIIMTLLKKDELQSLLPISGWLTLTEIENDRQQLTLQIASSGIEITKNSSWLKVCPKCRKTDICVYHWELNKDKKSIKEADGNLKIYG